MHKSAVIGRVIRSNGLWYQVLIDEKKVVECRLKGKMRLNYDAFTNPVAVGDKVLLDQDLNEYIICDVLERTNYIVRESPSKKHLKHVIAANIDQAFLILTLKEPNIKRGFIDRFLINTEMFNIPTILVINKMDIYDTKDLEKLDEICAVYENMNYPIFPISIKNNENIEALKALIHNKTTLISGNSGVGKSSLLNVIMQNAIQRTNNLSSFTGKGMHTTTFVEMFNVNENTYIVDSPGIKEFDVIHLAPNEISRYMRDFILFAIHCQYSDCTHVNEPKCAVKRALDNGDIDFIRYQNYIHILEIISSKNYWERK